jgi:hypothetical protein
MTKKEFLEGESIAVSVAGVELTLSPKRFSTGSVGYGFAGSLPIGGRTYQLSLNVVAARSKDWPEGV